MSDWAILPSLADLRLEAANLNMEKSAGRPAEGLPDERLLPSPVRFKFGTKHAKLQLHVQVVPVTAILSQVVGSAAYLLSGVVSFLYKF